MADERTKTHLQDKTGHAAETYQQACGRQRKHPHSDLIKDACTKGATENATHTEELHERGRRQTRATTRHDMRDHVDTCKQDARTSDGERTMAKDSMNQALWYASCVAWRA